MVRRRRLVAAAVGVVLLIVIVFLVNSCVDSRHERALKDYNRDVASLVRSSDEQVSKQLFDVLDGGGNANEVETAVQQVRLAADEDAKQAKDLNVPGDMSAAQRNLELTLNLRATGVRRIADQIASALSDQPAAERAQQLIAGQMQAFLASDVVYSQRVAPLIKQALDENGIRGQIIADSKFLPSIGWLDPQQVATRLGASGGAGSSSSDKAAPGLHGHGLLSVSAGGVTLQPGGVSNHIPAGSGVSFDITFANQGDNDETNVQVQVRITGAGAPIVVSKRVNQTRAKQNAEVTIPLSKTPPIDRAVTIEVSIAKVKGEQKTDNNKQTYTAIFTR